MTRTTFTGRSRSLAPVAHVAESVKAPPLTYILAILLTVVAWRADSLGGQLVVSKAQREENARARVEVDQALKLNDKTLGMIVDAWKDGRKELVETKRKLAAIGMELPPVRGDR